MIHWKAIEEFIEPNWEKLGTSGAPVLFWRGAKGALLGYVRDGELFDHKWIYVCDANKVSHVKTPLADLTVGQGARRACNQFYRRLSSLPR